MQNIVGQTEKNDLLVMQTIIDQNREKNPIYRDANAEYYRSIREDHLLAMQKIVDQTEA